MKITLEKNGEEIERNVGWAYYVFFTFLPFGTLITLIISIIRKEFKMYWVNSLVIEIIISLFTFALLIFGLIAYDLSFILGSIIVFIAILFPIVASITYVILVSKYLNDLKIKQLMDDGYIIIDSGYIPRTEIEARVSRDKYPWWCLIR